jgi:tRNA(Ile)-lysidine synthase
MPRSELLEYAQMHHLHWVEDESNRDENYPRNYLRHQLMPLLAVKFPSYRETISRSARHFAEAAVLLDELAQQDAQGWRIGEPFNLALLHKLSLPRRKNLLRYVIQRAGALLPQEVQLEEMLVQLCEAKSDATVCINFGEWQIRRYQAKAYVMRALSRFEQNLLLAWKGESTLHWPAQERVLIFEERMGQGISWAKLRGAPVTVRLRRGGEVIRPQIKSSQRTLKNLLQELQIPPWQRDRLPLVYCGQELVCVVGVAIHASYQAQENEMGIVVR